MTLRAIVRTNAAGSCLWCGQRLASWRTNGEHFCTTRCAQTFGMAAANSGFRFKPYTAPDALERNRRPPRRKKLETDVCAYCTLTRAEHRHSLHDFVLRQEDQ